MSDNTQTDLRAVAFYSVDVVDSAAYKGAHPRSWPDDFRSFFRDFPRTLSTTSGTPGLLGQQLPPPVEWKKLGDELAYCVDLCEACDALHDLVGLRPYELVFHYSLAMTSAIRAYNATADERLARGEPAFKVKGAAWFANVNHDPGYKRNPPDFMGLQVDVGFRIAKYSDLSRFAVSVEYAILLLRDNYLTIEDNSLDLHYDGRQPIKGPFEKLGYPVIYIDMSDSLQKAENRLLIGRQAVDRLDLMRFMQEYVKRAAPLIQYPFVRQDDPLFCHRPTSVTTHEV